VGDRRIASSVDERLRRRRKEVIRHNGRVRLLLFAVLALILLSAAGVWWLSRSSSLSVRQISVPVLEHVLPAEMEEAAAGARGVNLLRLDVGAIEGKLRSIPYVREVYVHKRYPDGLVLEIEEYRQFAVAKLENGTAWLVADDGRVLQEVAGDVPEEVATPSLLLAANVEVLRGARLPEYVVACLPILSLVRADKYWASDHPVARLSVSATGLATLVLVGGGEVRLGDRQRWQTKLQVASQVIDAYLDQGKSLEYVDVQTPERAVAKAKGADVP